MAISVPCEEGILQFLLRPPKTFRKVILSPLSTCLRLFPSYQMKLRTVVAALQPNAAPRNSPPIRLHLDLYIVFLNVEAAAELMKPRTGPQDKPAAADARGDLPNFHTSRKPLASPSHAPREALSESEARQRASRARSECRPPSSYRVTSRAAYNRPTTTPAGRESE